MMLELLSLPNHVSRIQLNTKPRANPARFATEVCDQVLVANPQLVGCGSRRRNFLEPALDGTHISGQICVSRLLGFASEAVISALRVEGQYRGPHVAWISDKIDEAEMDARISKRVRIPSVLFRVVHGRR